MASHLFRRMQLRRSSANLKKNLNATYTPQEVTRTASPAGNGLISIRGQLYPGPTLEAATEVVNIGRPASALYAAKQGGGSVSIATLSSGGTAGGGGTIDTTPFLRKDGSVALIGNWTVNPGITIDGVDISAHAVDPDAHHARVTAGDGINVLGQLVAVDSTVVRTHAGQTIAAVHAFSPGAPLAPFTLGANAQGQTVIGFKADQLNKSIVAGDGITLPAGGALTGNVTVAVNASDLADGDFGIEVFGNDFRAKLASNGGLTLAGGISISLASPSGLQLVSNQLSLATPGSISVSTANTIGTNHTHATIASSNPGAAEVLLKSTTDGGLTLESMLINGALTVGEGILAGASGFRVLYHTHDYNHVHVVVNPGGSWNLDEQFGVDIDDNLLVRGWIVGKHAIQLPGATLIAHFDGPEPYESNFKGETTGHMGQVGTVTGGVIFRPGKFGKAVQMARSNTNLIPNPSFEDNYATNYDQSGTITFNYTSAYSVTGSRSAQIFTNASGEGYGYICTSVTSAGSQYRFSAYVRGTGIIRLSLFDDVSSHQYSSNITLTSDWQRVSHDAIFHASSTNRRVYITQATGTDCGLFTDDWQLEAGTILTPYTDGSLGTGHAWTGTAHQSTSTRTGTDLTYLGNGPLNPQAGTIMAWAYRDAGGAYGVRHDVFAILEGATEKLEFYQASGELWTCRAFNGTDYTYALNGVAWTPTNASWNHLCITWTTTTLTIYRNGVLWSEGTGMTTGVVFNLASDVIHAGGPSGWDGLIDDVVIADRAITADEVRAIYESNAPVFAETSTWHWRSGRNRVWADTEGLWIVNAAGSAVLAAYAGNDDGTGTKSWGGVSMASSDVLIGDSNRGGYVWWDDSAATVQVKGSIIIQAGSSGIGNVTDAGALATADDLDDVADGATHKKTTADEKTGAGRAFTGLNSSGSLITKVIPGVTAAPSGAGLYLGSDFLGYYNGSVWKSVMTNTGDFALNNGASTNYLAWNGTTLTIDGAIVVRSGSGLANLSDANLDSIANTATSSKVNTTIIAGGLIQVGSGTKDSTLSGWHISSTEIVGQASGVDQVVLGTDGKITAGVGNVVLDVNGYSLKVGTSYSDATSFKFTDAALSPIGYLNMRQPSGENEMDVSVLSKTGRNSDLDLQCTAPSGKEATLELLAQVASGGLGVIRMVSNTVSDIEIEANTILLDGNVTVSGVVAADLTIQRAASTTLTVSAVDAANDRTATLRLAGSGNGGALTAGAIIDFTDSDATPATPGAFLIKKDANTHLAMLSNGTIGFGGITAPTATIHAARGAGSGGTAIFQGTNYSSIFNAATDENTFIRSGKSGAYVAIMDDHAGEVMMVSGGGKVGVGLSLVTAPAARLDVNQGSSSGAMPTLKLYQDDLSEQFIEFGTTVGAGNPANTDALGAYYGRLRISIGGTMKWLAVYS